MKCKICQRYIEAPEFLKSGVCSAICFGITEERERIKEKVEYILKSREKKGNKGRTKSREFKNRIRTNTEKQ